MTGPAPAPGLDDLRQEFPAWAIDTTGRMWRATRNTARTGPLELTAGSYGQLRALLDETDRVDCRHAIIALRDALRARGLEAEVIGLTVVTATSKGIQRTVHARRGTYTWTPGVHLAPIGDPGAAAEQMLPGLGLRP